MTRKHDALCPALVDPDCCCGFHATCLCVLIASVREEERDRIWNRGE